MLTDLSQFLPEGLGVLAARMQLRGGGGAGGVGLAQGHVLDGGEVGGESPDVWTHKRSHWTATFREKGRNSIEGQNTFRFLPSISTCVVPL